jgi:hypothetical protein
LEAELVRIGVSADSALRRVRSSPSKSYMPQEVVRLRDAYEATVARGNPDNDLLDSLDSFYGGKHWPELVNEGPRALTDRLAREESTMAIDAVASKYRERALSIQKRLEQWHSAKFYLADFPKPIGSAQTDADGEFTLAVPSRGAYVLGAETSREVSSDSEDYVWLIRVPEGARSGTKVLLSNETLVTGDSPLSLLHTEK